MSRRAKPVDPTMSLAHFFGAEVRRRRVRLGWSQQDLADRVLHGVDLVRKVESAERFPSRRLIVSLDEVLGTNGALLRIFPVLEREHELRAARRRADRPGTGLAAMDGDAAVLEWLVEPGPHRDGSAQEWPDCEDLLVLEQLRARDGRVGAGDTYPDVLDRLGVGLEDLAARAPGVAVGFLELAGYQSVDLGADGSARGHYLRALQITSGAGDRRYGGYLVGVSLAHLALHADDPVRAERYARAALRGTRACSTPGMRAAFHAVVARARARLGDGAGCTVALTMSESALAQRVCADEPSWMRYFGDADLADEKAHCFWDLGGDVAAQREAAGAIAGMAPTRVRRLAIDTALRASALARAGDVDAACATGRVAVGVASRTASYRGVEGVARMLAHLQPYADAAVVRDLVDHAGEVLRAPGGSGVYGT